RVGAAAGLEAGRHRRRREVPRRDALPRPRVPTPDEQGREVLRPAPQPGPAAQGRQARRAARPRRRQGRAARQHNGELTMASDLWSASVPDAKEPWNLARVVHLHRRAAFAGTWAELQRDLADGPEKAVGRLLSGSANLHSPADYEATATLLADAAVSQG